MKQASTKTVKCARNEAGAKAPASRKSSAPRPNVTATDLPEVGSPAPWPWPDFFAGAAAGLAACGGAAGNLGGGGGHVMAPSLMTVRPRIASSSMLTLMTPSLVLQSSSVTRSRLVEYSVDDCLARRLTRSV